MRKAVKVCVALACMTGGCAVYAAYLTAGPAAGWGTAASMFGAATFVAGMAALHGGDPGYADEEVEDES